MQVGKPNLGEATRQPLLQLAEAAVVRSGKEILSIGSLEIAQGEHLAILGPNGSGKSTLVKLLTREVLPLHRDEAPVRFKGEDRIVVADVKKCIGVVSASMQEQIAAHLPVLEVVCGGFFGTLGVPRHCVVTPESSMHAVSALEKLGIADLADRDVLTLSTGQARRVLFARALLNEPEVLVCDEPCTGLDPAGMHAIRSSMRKLAQEGTSIVLVTHYPEDILPEIERVVLLKEGKLFADGPKDELLCDETISLLFDAPLQVLRNQRYYSLVSSY